MCHEITIVELESYITQTDSRSKHVILIVSMKWLSPQGPFVSNCDYPSTSIFNFQLTYTETLRMG
jgi:hypothetical protein